MTVLIETIRVQQGTAPLWPLHAARLRAASGTLGIRLPHVEAPEGGADRVVRIAVAAGGVSFSVRDAAIPDSIALRVTSHAHAAYPWKTEDRLVFDLAHDEAVHAGADDALLLTGEGLVAEASRWALVWRQPGGAIAAPPLALGVLRSVARERLSQLLAGRLVEARVRLDGILGCPAAVLNAARGIVAVAAIDGQAVPPWDGWAALRARFWS
ncbi:MAG TPA: aminotransferase class IV [Gemmatimonadales bacterium]|nr:aminotransferase class IV [Gemmatimonadales bacterium]